MLIDLKVLGDWKSVIGGALGLVSAIFTAFGPTIRDRNVHVRRLAAYDAATKQVTYYDFWLKASLAADPSAESEFRAEMKSAIDRIQAELYQALGQLAPPPQKIKPSLIKRVFLLYKPLRARAWLPRVLFYSLATLTLLGVIVGILDSEVRYDSEFWLGYFVIFLVCLAFRTLSRVME